jgi:hypothetical protein
MTTQIKTKILLRLVSIPAISGSLLGPFLLAGPAFEAQAATTKVNVGFCSLPQDASFQSPNIQSLLHSKASLLVASNSNTLAENMLYGEFSPDFTEAESDAAVALFGCDCASCMTVLQQLRRQPVAQKGTGHCFSNLARRGVSQERMQEVLQELDAQEAIKNL